MIRKFLVSTAALAALAGTAAAADLPSRRAPPVYVPPPIPVFTWTGAYIGVQGGYEFGRSSARLVRNGGVAGANSASPDGVIGGAHIGYLWSTQAMPGIRFMGTGGVIGVEGDVDGSNYKSSYLLNDVTASDRQSIQGSIRGRLGVAVDRALFYATGGAAFGGLQNNYFSAFGNETFNHTRVGWTAGGGVEYAFTNNWSARVEYRYTDFGNVTDTLVASVRTPASVTRRETDNRVQAGVSYRFDTFGPAPVVARY